MNDRITILYVGNVRSERGIGGSVVLHRHLEAARERFDVEVLSPPAAWKKPWSFCRRLARFLQRFGSHSAENLCRWIDERRAEPWLNRKLKGAKNAIVLTVAHGHLAYVGADCAKKAGLPLVTIFHDWWPDCPFSDEATRRRDEQRFLQMHQKSDVSFPVSEGMREALGQHPASTLLYPIPEIEDAFPRPVASLESGPFRILYAGNLADYGPMLGEALQAAAEHPGIRLEVRGPGPHWPVQLKEEMRNRGQWLDFAPRSELELWLGTADAFLVCMDFKSALRRRMETSFPSKLTEYSRYGRPLVIWGPEYSSAVKWAMESGAALCVTSSRPEELVSALGKLAVDAGLRERLGTCAYQAYKSQFHPGLLQEIFEKGFRKAIAANGSGPATR